MTSVSTHRLAVESDAFALAEMRWTCRTGEDGAHTVVSREVYLFFRDCCPAKGVTFVREPENAPYGMVAVFQDLYGNPWLY